MTFISPTSTVTSISISALWLVTFAFPVYVARRDVGRARWAYKVARLWVPTLAKHFQVSFRTFFRFFGFFCCFFGKVSCSPTECDGDWRRHVFFYFFELFLSIFWLVYLLFICACVCVLFFSFSMIINMETNKASQTKWREALGERAFG